MIKSARHSKTTLDCNELFWHRGRAFIWVSISNPSVNLLPEEDCAHSGTWWDMLTTEIGVKILLIPSPCVLPFGSAAAFIAWCHLPAKCACSSDMLVSTRSTYGALLCLSEELTNSVLGKRKVLSSFQLCKGVCGPTGQDLLLSLAVLNLPCSC